MYYICQNKQTGHLLINIKNIFKVTDPDPYARAIGTAANFGLSVLDLATVLLTCWQLLTCIAFPARFWFSLQVSLFRFISVKLLVWSSEYTRFQYTSVCDKHFGIIVTCCCFNPIVNQLQVSLKHYSSQHA